jgi:predicted small secreted protein
MMQVPRNERLRMIGVAVCATVIVVIICMCASGCSTARGVVHGARSIGGGILTDVEAMIDGVSQRDGERPDHWDVPVERAK